MRVESFTSTNGLTRYILVDSSGVPVDVVLRFLRFKDNCGRARNTLRAYCFHLKSYFEYLEFIGMSFPQIGMDELAGFIRWLQNNHRQKKIMSFPAATVSTCSAQTINVYLSTIYAFYDYLSRHEEYPQINSFSEISIDEMVPAWLNYVALSGRKSSRQGYRAQIYQLYLFFSDFYDTRDEYEKDIWDCRKIPSVDIPVHAVNHLINFTFIPAAFQRLAKKYIKTRLVICALSTVRLELEAITYFLQFIAEVEPTWTSLRHLTRRYIEDFIQKYLNAFPAKTRRQLDKLLSTRNFLLRIQQFD